MKKPRYANVYASVITDTCSVQITPGLLVDLAKPMARGETLESLLGPLAAGFTELAPGAEPLDGLPVDDPVVDEPELEGEWKDVWHAAD